MFRAKFDYLRGRIWGYAWKKKCSQMSGLQLLCWAFVMFTCEIWRSLDPKMISLNRSVENPEISLGTDLFELNFERVRDRLKTHAWNIKRRGMIGLQLFFWTISMFMYQFWRYLILNLRVQKENREEYADWDNRARAYPVITSPLIFRGKNLSETRVDSRPGQQ